MNLRLQETSLILQKSPLFDPHLIPVGKMKISNPYCTSARHAQSYPKVSSVFSWQCRCTSSDKLFLKKKKRRFSILIWPLGIKNGILKPYRTSTRHFQSYSRVSFTFSLKCKQSSSDNSFTKTSFFVLNWPLGQKWKL